MGTGADKPAIYQRMMSAIQAGIGPVILETFRLLPDSIVIGTALLSVISLCKSYGILVLTMVELMLVQRIIANMIGSIRPLGAGPDALHSVCQPGFVFPNLMRMSLLEQIGIPSSFPSPVLFFLTGLISYMVGSVREFSREIKSLGGDIGVRTIVGIVLSSFLIFVTFGFRLTYGCETYGTLFISMILGLMVGIAIIYQNIALFGRDGINILNLPMILTATESGKPMYVCAPSGM